MPRKFLEGIQHSLKGIEPPNGIAYLLHRVDQEYWIPVATSHGILDAQGLLENGIPYYRLSYNYSFDRVPFNVPQLIEEDIIGLIQRGKIEAIDIGTSFYQEIIQVGCDEAASLVIVRSSANEFSCLSNDAINGMKPLMLLSHLTWGDRSFSAIEEDRSTKDKVSPIDIARKAAQKAAELLSDKHRFPPYFLLTDYILSVYLSDSFSEEHICSNPLGYSYWIHRKLSVNPPPWIRRMSKEFVSYSEDLLAPQDDSLKSIYSNSLIDADILATLLTDKLRDDVILVSYVPDGPQESATYKFWARHNRLKGSSSILAKYEAIGCKTLSEALCKLLVHCPHEDELNTNENDFLVVSWATYSLDGIESKSVHIGCDTSHRLSLFNDKKIDINWKKLSCPGQDDSRPSHPRIEIKYRPAEFGTNNCLGEDILRVLNFSFDKLSTYCPLAAIDYFYKQIKSRRDFYKNVLFPISSADDRHNFPYWRSADKDTIVSKYMNGFMSDLRLIGHLGKWNGFKEYDDNFRMSYVYIANGLKEDRIAGELIEFLFDKIRPTERDTLEYIKCPYGKDYSELLQGFHLLRHDGKDGGWELAFAEPRKSILTKENIFAVGLVKSGINPEGYSKLAESAFTDTTTFDTGQFRVGSTWLRKFAKNFSFIGHSDCKVTLYIEFEGGAKS